MSTQENLKPLKMLVFSMGVLLLGGVVLLGALVIKKVNQEAFLHSPGGCPGGKIDLKGHGAITSSTIEGHTMHLTLDSKGQSETLLIDICSGKILTTLTIDRDGK